MYRFCRAAIAIIAGTAVGVKFNYSFVRLLSGRCPVDDWLDTILGNNYTDAFLGFLPPFVAFCGIYGLLSYCFSPENQFPREIRCRKCQYILQGITESRCPECGEKI